MRSPAAVQAGQELPAEKGGRPVPEEELRDRGGARVPLQGTPQQGDPEDAGVWRHGGDHTQVAGPGGRHLPHLLPLVAGTPLASTLLSIKVSCTMLTNQDF